MLFNMASKAWLAAQETVTELSNKTFFFKSRVKTKTFEPELNLIHFILIL